MATMASASQGEKRMRGECSVGTNFFHALSDDLIIDTLTKISASAKSPSDLLGVISSCKRMKKLGMLPIVLVNASRDVFAIHAKSWCDQAHRFLSCCSDAGNMEACYILGMIEFYCLGHYASGAELLARAAEASHPEALYSLAIIQSRGSGNNSEPHCCHDPESAAALCAKSAMLGHPDAITDIGYCLWSCADMSHPPDWVNTLFVGEDEIEEKVELDEDQSNSMPGIQSGRHVHPANLFLAEWWQLPNVKSKRESDGLELCSRLCGRRETRRNEFYRCGCNKRFYCSRGCQNVHWETEHQDTCLDMIRE